MNFKNALLPLVLVSTLMPSLSQAGMIYGHGSKSCGQWLEARKESNTSNDALYFSVWVTGFVTGVGYAGIDLKESDPDGRDNWIDNYCEKYPLELVGNAAGALVNELAE